jgi:hypothetical protein
MGLPCMSVAPWVENQLRAKSFDLEQARTKVHRWDSQLHVGRALGRKPAARQQL